MASNLEDYLSYYRKREKPGYAVLVTGEWGVGKTFQVKAAIPEAERYCVSLYGLQTADEIHSAVLVETDPTLSGAKKLFAGLEQGARMTGGVVGGAGTLGFGIVSAALRRKTTINRTLIFDDLERCGLDLNNLLGVINAYVEHRGCRVVVIAHDAKILGLPDVKEKIFGQTIRVEPQIDGAFDVFRGTLKDKQKEFLNEYRSDVIKIFNESKASSLRVLKHLIEDLARLHDALDDAHLDRKEGMRDLVRLFSVYNIEVRMGKLKKKGIIKFKKTALETIAVDMMSGSHKGSKKYKQSKGDIIDAKYKDVDISDPLLEKPVIVDMFVNGLFDQCSIQRSLNKDYRFRDAEEPPPWRVVIGFDRTDDDEVNDAAKRMQQQFDNREIEDPGEMLHVFALRLMMSENGILDGDLDAVAASCRKYIDDLLAERRLPARETDWDWKRSIDQSCEGLGYWAPEATGTHFDGIFEHLVSCREKALEQQYPEIIANLLDLVKTDGEAFFGQVCNTHAGDNPYAHIPILSHIPAADFVAAWMESPKANWRWLGLALDGRYGHGRPAGTLPSEEKWVREVVALFEAEAGKAEGFVRLRIKRALPADLMDDLRDLDAPAPVEPTQ